MCTQMPKQAWCLQEWVAVAGEKVESLCFTVAGVGVGWGTWHCTHTLPAEIADAMSLWTTNLSSSVIYKYFTKH